MDLLQIVEYDIMLIVTDLFYHKIQHNLIYILKYLKI
jgi:hypothetical protein